MKLATLALILFASCVTVSAQSGPISGQTAQMAVQGSGAITGACSGLLRYTDVVSGITYLCDNQTTHLWQASSVVFNMGGGVAAWGAITGTLSAQTDLNNALAGKALSDLSNVTGSLGVTNFPTTVDTNSGVKSASTIRFVLATDQPALTNALKVDGSAVTQPVSIASMPSTPVTGTFFQATQPVSGTFFQATQPVSLGGGLPAALDGSGFLKVHEQGTATVSGTVTANAGSGTFNIQSNASVNVAQINGVTALMGNGATGTGSQRVTIASDNTAFSVNAAQSGTWTDRIVGNAGAAFDAANNAAMPANSLSVGAETIAQGSQPTAATAGNLRRALASTEGVLYVQEGNSNRFSCFLQAVTVTTQCQATPGAGLRAYVTSVHFSNQVATVQTLDVVFGTGTNCATGTAALTHKFQMGTNATTTSPQSIDVGFQTPLIPTAANAICLRPSAATAFGVTVTGYIAP